MALLTTKQKRGIQPGRRPAEAHETPEQTRHKAQKLKALLGSHVTRTISATEPQDGARISNVKRTVPVGAEVPFETKRSKRGRQIEKRAKLADKDRLLNGASAKQPQVDETSAKLSRTANALRLAITQAGTEVTRASKAQLMAMAPALETITITAKKLLTGQDYAVFSPPTDVNTQQLRAHVAEALTSLGRRLKNVERLSVSVNPTATQKILDAMLEATRGLPKASVKQAATNDA